MLNFYNIKFIFLEIFFIFILNFLKLEFKTGFFFIFQIIKLHFFLLNFNINIKILIFFTKKIKILI